ncbi:ChbG/HpnK family deacetylase [Piscinibacter terrae]|uniref:ChbG/HpnK family deacetylase n=1 Tax=Piscinibacter terrae TaxID=2496871 RepID=A0A3N7HU73_9BURK|nr:ChbG/HpnK family deacetylase [Albitalea terrae]RQP24461.1 ChbG/HpnK family deacetylase [Albitalea terrae]
MMKTLALCADDFGMSRGVSARIAQLAARGRINATSCLTNAAHWPATAPMLKGLPEDMDVGLHFNLSEGQPLSAELRRVWPQMPPLPQLIAKAHLRLLPLAAIAAEFDAQHAAFVEAMGRDPAFVDGHQHVHHLPGVRDRVLASIGQWADTPAVRHCGDVRGPGFAVKRALIAGTGGRALRRALDRRGIARNAALLGVYDFVPGSYRQWMKGWLRAVPHEGALLFCHPGAADGEGDAIASARGPEADYFDSSEFLDDLAEAGVRIGRAWRAVKPPR